MEVVMTNTPTSSEPATEAPQPGVVEMKLEVVLVPVPDVDRAKAFYERLGWRLDADFVISEDFRVVQLTPPGSEASIIFGNGLTSAAPGSLEGLQLTVVDIEAARDELARRCVDVELFHDAGGVFHHAGTEGRPRSAAFGLWLVRVLQRSGRQRLAAPRDQDAGSRTLTGAAPRANTNLQRSTRHER
jgi:catechol 2,3-dioxygenase-like lactoylglutathione lyase family enzyme